MFRLILLWVLSSTLRDFFSGCMYVASPDLSQVSECCMNVVENHFFSFTKFSQSNNGQWAVTPSTNTSRLVTVDSTMSLSDTHFVKYSKA